MLARSQTEAAEPKRHQLLEIAVVDHLVGQAAAREDVADRGRDHIVEGADEKIENVLLQLALRRKQGGQMLQDAEAEEP